MGESEPDLETPERTAAPDPLGAAGDDATELAEDVVDLLRRVRSIEKQQRDLALRLEQIGRALSQRDKITSRSLNELRRDLFGSRRGQAARRAFDATLPVLESMTALLHGLHEVEDARMRRQLRAVVSGLSNLVQGLGFEQFEVASGVPFDPQSMDCVEHGEGESGTVLECIHPGYRCDEVVVRPAGVRIGSQRHREEEGGSS